MQTPLVAGETSSSKAQVLYKTEIHQHTHAFKFRGAYNFCVSLAPSLRSRGLVTASSGNHALGLSRAGSMLGARVTVIMPDYAPAVKESGCLAYGAEVIRHGQSYEAAAARARQFAAATGATYVPSFDDQTIAAGQSTIAWEIVEQLPDVEVIVSPIGGGGLLAGLIGLIKTLPQPLAAQLFPRRRKPLAAIRIVGVQAQGACSMVQSVASGAKVTLAETNTVADGIAVLQPGDWTWRIAAKYADAMVTVDDDAILRAVGALAVRDRLVVEPAGAASVAAVTAAQLGDRRVPILTSALAEGRAVVCILSGGNVQPDLLARCIEAAGRQPPVGRVSEHSSR